jgi:hypothetical protein
MHAGCPSLEQAAYHVAEPVYIIVNHGVPWYAINAKDCSTVTILYTGPIGDAFFDTEIRHGKHRCPHRNN